jgi:hypothetical protein
VFRGLPWPSSWTNRPCTASHTSVIAAPAQVDVAGGSQTACSHGQDAGE